MKKYQPLTEYLENCGQERITLSYEEIEKIIGDKLPEKSAYCYQQWWANNETQKSRHTYAWLDAGYKTVEIRLGHSITFERK